MHYEELVSDPQETLNGSFDFLEVANVPTPISPLRKMTPDRLRDAIENFDEVAALLRGTEFEQFLE